MDILSKLNPEQRRAVEHGSGPALVLAGAGSGKTRVITYRIAYLIRNGAARPENILAVTFTNKAADEMRERVHALLGPLRSAEPLISTFHSFCVRLLRREIERLGYKRDFSIYDTDDQKRLMKQVLREAGETERDYPPGRALSRISLAKNHGIRPESFAENSRDEDAARMASIFARYNAALRRANALDFDDLLLKAGEVLEKFPDRRAQYSEQYRYILVDEYQDTNRIQYDLLRLLTARHSNIFVVGDEDQSIYRFRGANIQNILNFERDFPGARVIKLEQNYRSTQNILSVAGAVVRNNTERKGKTLWTGNQAGDLASCHRSSSARNEALWAADRISELLEENDSCHIAVLYRANFLSRNFEDVLLDRGIPYALVGSVAFFGRKEIKDMLAYLRLIYNPEDDVALLRIINTPPRGIGNATVEMLTRTALQAGIPLLQAFRNLAGEPERIGRSHRAAQQFLRMLDGWTSARDDHTLAELLERIVESTHYRAMLEKQESAQEAENRMANIEELVSASAESQERGETAFEFLDRASLSSELDHLDPNARVALMTVHSAKGLEFDTVFLVGMEEGLFPHALSSQSAEDLEEERRLCYVGLTRARHKLFVSWTPFRRRFGPDGGEPADPSRFLSEMPPELVEGFGFEDDYLHEDEDDDEYETEPTRKPERRKQSAGVEPREMPRTIAELRAYVESSSGKGAAPAVTGAPALKPGARVRHAQFGDGIILKRERAGNDIKLTVTFSRVGKKTLIERYARLEVL